MPPCGVARYCAPGCAGAAAQRNELIYQLGQRFFRNGSLRARARALIAAAKLYRDGEWRHHRALTAPPDSIAGTARELMWRAFKAHEFPFGQRTIENSVSAQRFNEGVAHAPLAIQCGRR